MKKSVKLSDRNKFLKFYQTLFNKENIFYLYCTGNLLHYVIANVEFHKSAANFVLVTGGLSTEEKDYIANNISIPFCHFDNKYIDFYIWDILVETSGYNFGWLDIDCFVWNKSIFQEISRIDKNICINAIWKRQYKFYKYDRALSSTFIQFINIEIAHKIYNQYKKMSMIPVSFSDVEEDRAFEDYIVLEDSDVRDILDIYSEAYSNTIGLDTTHYYQIVASSLGYKINFIRDLSNNDYTDEIIHLGGAHRIHNLSLGLNKHRFYDKFNLRYSFYLLYKCKARLPSQYEFLLSIYESNLLRNKVSIELEYIEKKIIEFIELNKIYLPYFGDSVTNA